ncbi:MAG: hypothetical protein GY751_17205, partial [Bacteroidetes bacterium]|nr:hypothetical protein [Bacteroidota bacterium]
PGISFLARDLIRGGDPVLVEERSATQTLAPWDHVAMLLVEVRGHTIISGGILPFDNDMSQEIVEEVLEGVDDDAANSELTHELAILARLKTTAPLFSEYWLTETMHDFVEDITPRMTNSDGDEIEFIKFHFRFKKGTTQAKIHNALEKADDLDAIGEKVWNWIDVGGESSQTNTKNSPAHSLDGHTILGNLKMHGKILEAQTNSAARAERLQPMLEALTGDLLHPPLMVRQTLEQAMQDYRENPSHSEAVELPTEEENEIIKQLLDKQYRATLDQPVGMLGDETPRNAAKTKAGKKKLVEWLKYLEQQTAKHQFPNSQSTYDFTWIWQELGVTDLRK